VASVRLTRRITSTCQSPPLPRAAGSDCAQWVEPREGFRRVRGCTRKSIGSTRSQAWRPSASHALARSESGHHLRDVISSAIRPNCARRQSRRVQMRARSANGRLLVDSPSDWDHNLGLRAQIETVANDADTANAGDGSVSARPGRDGSCRRLWPRPHRGTSAADTAMTPSRPGMGACARSWPH
jgi:hypothetical protein